MTRPPRGTTLWAGRPGGRRSSGRRWTHGGDGAAPPGHGKLAGQEPAWVRFRQDRKLQLELERLDAMGFIEPTDLRGLNAIPQDHAGRDEEFDLRRYVTITGEGREYLALRRRLHGGD